ncbi:hypothetical protein CA13_62280 [Planctomycetes bacterium CA13]|uniref:Uncharacterized protein n=1 Tax=Novipirellula herctigrandis TaxID=2527986 RepID=A0A5C5ZC74_9BACT|nr:hypothetical protein CA13_62280 [Planctomycetes bacterium CA13]
MKNLTKHSMALFIIALTAIATYRISLADSTATSQLPGINEFGDSPCLVTFNIGPGGGQSMGGVQRTVLVNATFTDISGKRFLGGIVTDKYTKFTRLDVEFPGTQAYISFDRIACIELLDVAKDQSGG